jgi:plastocyanin
VDKDIFYISLFLIIIGVGGQLAWIFFGGIPCNASGQPYLLGAPCDSRATAASFQELENVTGYAMLIGLILLPAGLFKDGLPIPGPGAKVFLGILLIIFVGIGFTSLLLMPSATTQAACTQNCAIVTILKGSGENPNAIVTFSPKVITVIMGVNNTVKWINDDTVSHTVKGDTLSSLSSPLINPGQTYIYTFNQPGNYSYFCTIHLYMHGEVIVKAHA